MSTAFCVTDYGAVGDGQTLDTSAIQQAIDAAHEAGGGRVTFPAGLFHSGSLFLRSHVTLDLPTGTVLLASTDIADYPVTKHWDDEARKPFVNPDMQPHSFLFGLDCDHITVCGGGEIRLPGEAFWDVTNTRPSGWIPENVPRVSPSLVFHNCTNVRLLDVTIRNSSGWTVETNSCRYVWIRGIRLENNRFGPNTDGLDIQGCQDVFVSDCHIDCADDAIVLKTLPDTPPNERITVTNCVLRTQCVGLKLGCNESFQDMRQITFSNCVVYESTRAIGLYATCGANYEDICISNIVCDTEVDVPLNRPITIDLRRRREETKHPYRIEYAGSIRNVQIENVICKTDGRILITAENGYMIENVTLRDIRMDFYGLDDPVGKGRNATSGQWCLANPDAGEARAAVAVENIRNLVVQDLQCHWPDDYDGPPFAVLWGRNLQGGLLDNPLALPSHESAETYQLDHSTIRVRE